MKHLASSAFWEAYQRLPADIRDLANKNYEMLKQNPQHPSLHFKKKSVDSGRFVLAAAIAHLAVQENDNLVWFWIGSHADYDRLIG
jgi:hypothetical protein